MFITILDGIAITLIFSALVSAFMLCMCHVGKRADEDMANMGKGV